MNERRLLTTGDMARLTGNTLRTVRFYEEAGVLVPQRRSSGGHRLFTQRDRERLQMITDLRAAGLSLDEIRGLLAIKDRCESGAEAATCALEAIDEQLATLNEKIAVFTRLRDELERTRAILADCTPCTDSAFPRGCRECRVLQSHGEPPASMRVLWDLTKS